MTSPEKKAVEAEGAACTDEIAKKPDSVTNALHHDERKHSSATIQQLAIMNAATYWGLDYGSLPNNEA